MTEKLRAAAGTTLKKVFRSYAILFLFTFSELLLGFVLLGEAYAFLLALVTALVDSLPVFGTGTVLLPLALYRFFTGDSHTATGFLILYAAVTVIRQILEPKILGKGVGMHPLLMLISMYAGLKLFGIFGMIVIPILAMIAKSIIPLLRAPEKENSYGAS
jgi:sporulation integral membrane protein YtvI